jgi:hypothetical protein
MKYCKTYYLVSGNGKLQILGVESHLPFKLGEIYFYKDTFQLPYPYKVVVEERNIIPPYAIAVRTDEYPLWWVAVLLLYKLENLGTKIKYFILRRLYSLGLLHCKPGEIPSWKHIGFKKET